MKKTILVAGATGNLGEKICGELLKQGADVKAAVRSGSDPGKVTALKNAGVTIIEVDFNNPSILESACSGASCVISALAGLEEVIINTQSALLYAAIKAKVPRFIPSDFCTDYTLLPLGVNRNFDLRKAFSETINNSSIQATSIFNGAFSYVLKYNIPLLDIKKHSIGYFEDKSDWKIDFTTLENTAAFTACAALDDHAPRSLSIADFQISPSELQALSENMYNTPFQLQNLGTMDHFMETINKIRREHPEDEKELYPSWQQMQYLYCMFAAHHQKTENERYSGIQWIPAEKVLKEIN
ncbi:NmrA family NAD(P)-binding protein [Chryseobacterium salviniae]|uniref:NmrA family NAD(P)-binding protein n=1 Tax=Chryseobacterium salviniae TaxID=3101750 RepID=A0ABU6HP15_9FLAO|nr:NmrA family NAD(P)-binding protein [Chryseobacterium sp. T9W2-O]MEC3874346.1 NmrA family NAD(P)-binding protein [Chryseobacterium sp. T9W2-O]